VSGEPTDEALLSQLNAHGMTELGPEGLDVWFAQDALTAHEALWTLGLVFSLFVAIGALQFPFSVVGIAGALVSIVGLFVSSTRSLSRHPTIRLTGATLSLRGEPLPLEAVTVSGAHGRRPALHVQAGEQVVHLPVPHADAVAPLIALITRNVQRRKAALSAEGHDISQPANVPPEIAAIRER